MRIWSIHPKYLDSKGLVALWRESLLAKHVLEGRTKGYTNHPQLIRFRKSENALPCINAYLEEVYKEASRRGYNFDSSKFESVQEEYELTVTKGQLTYEGKHLLNKLKVRDKERYKAQRDILNYELHPLFKLIDGDIEEWERY